MIDDIFDKVVDFVHGEKKEEPRITQYEKLQNLLDAVNERIMFFTLPDTNAMRHLLESRANLEHRLHTMTVEEAHKEVVE